MNIEYLYMMNEIGKIKAMSGVKDENLVPDFGLVPLDEVKLNRVVTHHMEHGFIILSAYRSCEAEHGGNCTEEQKKEQALKNIINNKQIKKDIVSAGFSFIPVFGGFKEAVENPKTGLVSYIEVKEPSYIVPANRNKMTTKVNIDVEGVKLLGMQLCQKYNQDSFLFYDNKTAYFVSKDGKIESQFTDVALNDMSQIFFTQLKKGKERIDRRFSLTESIETMFSLYGYQAPGSTSEARERHGELFVRY